MIGTAVLGIALGTPPRGTRLGTAVLGTALGSRLRGTRLGIALETHTGAPAATLDATMLVIAPAMAAGTVSAEVGTPAETTARLRTLGKSLASVMVTRRDPQATAAPRHLSMR